MNILKYLLKALLIILLISSTYIGYSYLSPKPLDSPIFLNTEINEIQKLKAKCNILNTDISSAGIGWHLDHTLLTINTIYRSLKVSDTAENNSSSFNVPKILMFSLDFIPRGKAKAFEQSLPESNPDLKTIENHLKTTLLNLKRFDSLPPNSSFTHPYIGKLYRDEAKRFLKIHTKHHLKICYDILNKP